jgi:hypothetical protein
MVLGSGSGAGTSLWQFQGPDKWIEIGSAGEATALGRTDLGPVLAGSLKIQTLTWADPATPLASVALKWFSAIPADPVVAVDRSPSGQWAMVMSNGTRVGYATAESDGTATILESAPKQSLTPLVAWLDDTRLVVLNTDDRQVSKLAVIDTAAGKMTSIGAIGGIRCFALSGDRKTLVAATETDVYVAPVSGWLTGAMPKKIAGIEGPSVAWGYSLNLDGSVLAILTGAETADGRVSEPHEIVYARTGEDWAKAIDVAAPFATAQGQVWSK